MTCALAPLVLPSICGNAQQLARHRFPVAGLDQAPRGSSVNIKIAYIAPASQGSSEVFVKYADGTSLQLTHDGRKKWAPVFSPDGTKVAFAMNAANGRRQSVGEVAVVDETGSLLHLIQVQPVKQGLGYDAMQRIDFVQWKNQNTIAVGGGDFLKATDIEVYDLGSGEVKVSFIDPNGAYATSVNGAHSSILAFAGEEATICQPCHPRIYIDDLDLVIPDLGSYRFLSPVVWSKADPNNFALLVQDDYKPKQVDVVTGHVLVDTSVTHLGEVKFHINAIKSLSPRPGWGIFWHGNDLHISQAGAEPRPIQEHSFYKLLDGIGTLQSEANSQAVDPFLMALPLAQEVIDQSFPNDTIQVGGYNVNVYCHNDARCGYLNELPFRSAQLPVATNLSYPYPEPN